MILYITEQGSTLSKKGNRVIIMKGKQKIDEIPLRKIEKINLLGNIGLTTPVISFFLKNEIEVVFMSRYGKYKGKLYREDYRNVKLRLSQYEKSKIVEYQIKMSRDIVRGKLQNYYDFLNKKKKHIVSGKLGKQTASLRIIIEKLDNVNEIEKIRGLEGIGSKIYFSGYKELIKNPDFRFQKRIAHPPKDRINALLSFGYSRLYNEVEAAMNAVGLDLYFGNLHTLETSKKSLLFDLVEEYRVLIDQFILNMINRAEIKKEDFEIEEKDVVNMTKDGLKKFIWKYEMLLKQKRLYEIDGEQNLLRTIFEKQSRQYAQVVKEEKKEYQSFKLGG